MRLITLLKRQTKKTYLFRSYKKISELREKKQKRKKIDLFGEEIVEKLNLVFYELDIPYWLAFGTLLGAIRENGIIKSDLDLDIGVWKKDYSDQISAVMQKHGFKLSRKILLDEGITGLEESYKYKGVTIDIFYFEQEADKQIKCYCFYYEDNIDFLNDKNRYERMFVLRITLPFKGLKQYEFFNRKVWIPEEPHEHLKAQYGPNYMIPDPDWNYRTAPSCKKIEGKVGKVVFY